MTTFIISSMFNKYIGKQQDIENISKIPRSFRKNENKYKNRKNFEKDSRTANKNKRISNKDYKDFVLNN